MDFWASRVPVSRVIFELKGEIHEQIVKDAFRIASAKLPGNYETVKKGDVPVIGVTKLTPENIQKLLTRKGKVVSPLARWIKANPGATEVQPTRYKTQRVRGTSACDPSSSSTKTGSGDIQGDSICIHKQQEFPINNAFYSLDINTSIVQRNPTV